MTVMMPKGATEVPDAGLRSVVHYKRRLPPWRHRLRERCLPLIRWETPYLAKIQEALRTPALDSYFAITANLGTHTFFMVALPVLFWFGYTSMARAMIHILALGVFFTGFIKDLLCLPRPLSPPLRRITMSGSAALEYGFPSTHTTNAVSVAFYVVQVLRSSESTLNSNTSVILESLTYLYVVTIIVGRIYCGMHGFADVIVGGTLGAAISYLQWIFGERIDDYLYSGSSVAPILATLVTIVLVRIHPEPADDCPCFDDGVAFAGVLIGCELGCWHYATSGWAWDTPAPATVPFLIDEMGWPKAILRVVIGILAIFVWRGVMKPSLLRALPPVFRIIERMGLNLPRRFFVQASEYNKVPAQTKDDNVIPSVSELPALITSMRHPRRRAVSVGPQSAADAYETLAHRDKVRRESVSKSAMASPTKLPTDSPSAPGDYFTLQVTGPETRTSSEFSSVPPTPSFSKVASSDQLVDPGSSVYTPLTSSSEAPSASNFVIRDAERKQDEKEEREIFSKLEKPRVRYDVEVVTKLIVYSGICWIAVEGGPLIFELLGLGMPKSYH